MKEILTVKSSIPTDVIYLGHKNVPKPGDHTTVYGRLELLRDIAVGILDLDLNDSNVHNLINPNNQFNSELLYHLSKHCQFWSVLIVKS